MGHLFVSHASEDSILARSIAQGLETAGYHTWYYERDSYPGASYLSQILTALSTASAVLVILSPPALESHQIDKEVIQAHELGTPFVPVLNGLTHDEIRNRRREWAMAMGASVSVPVPLEGVAALLPRLLEGLRRVVGPPSAQDHMTPQTLSDAASAAAATALTPTPASKPRDNLPSEVTSFVGRERDQTAVEALLERVRLVTLRGMGGVGKTRLALKVAAARRLRYPDGVWLVELAPLTESTLVASKVAQALGVREQPGRALDESTLVISTVAQTLGVREEPGQSLLDALTTALRDRSLLLLLDNCEHLIAACAALATALLRSCPAVRVLATSREGLEVAGEHLYQVSPFAVPDPAHLPSIDHVAQFAAVQLFVERAQARRLDFALDVHNAATVIAICGQLDGIPLAIELAAARVAMLPVEGIAARLGDRFRLLTGGPRTALPQQQTLRAALDWSYDLLSASEQVLLRRLAVFAGGWTLQMAEEICAGDGVEDWEVLDVLGGLVNKSLVQEEEEAGGGARYGLLETVRQYGAEKLQSSGETAALRERHITWFLAVADQAETGLLGPEQGMWLARLEREHDNLRSALVWARENELVERGLRLAGALWRFWYMHGYLSEGCEWLEGLLVLDAGDDAEARRARVKALNGAGVLVEQQGDLGHATDLYEASLTLSQELGDKKGIAHALNSLGIAAMHRGDYERASALLEESLALRREQGDKWGIASALHNLGAVAWEQGNLGRATTLFEESLALRRTLGDQQGIASMLANLGIVARDQGDYARALDLSAESLALYRILGDQLGLANLLNNMGSLAQRRHDYARAEALYKESLALFDTVGSKALAAECLEMLASVACAQVNYARAARLSGAATAVRESIGAPLPSIDRAEHDRLVAELCAALGDSFAAAWAAGKALPVEQAIAYALAEQGGSRGDDTTTKTGDVLACV